MTKGGSMRPRYDKRNPSHDSPELPFNQLLAQVARIFSPLCLAKLRRAAASLGFQMLPLARNYLPWPCLLAVNHISICAKTHFALQLNPCLTIGLANRSPLRVEDLSDTGFILER